MKEFDRPCQESIGDQLIEDISQIKQIALGAGAATCEVCGTSLFESDSVVVVVTRSIGGVGYEVACVLCGDGHQIPWEFSVGVRELVVVGRIGRCSDGAVQESWQVLLAPDVLGVSSVTRRTICRLHECSSNEADALVAWDAEQLADRAVGECGGDCER